MRRLSAGSRMEDCDGAGLANRDCVQIVGLENSPKYNGVFGVIVGAKIVEKNRWPVLLVQKPFQRKKLSIHSRNLRRNYVCYKDSEFGGMGLFATRNFSLGDIIYIDWPILFTSSGFTNAQFCEELSQQFDELSEDDKNVVLGLAASSQWAPSQLENIYRTNSQDFSGGTVLLPTFSRMNHSCRANAGSNRYFEVRAHTDIVEGEQLFICYRGFPFALKPRDRRQKQLQELWGFTCRCPFCKEGDSPAHKKAWHYVGFMGYGDVVQSINPSRLPEIVQTLEQTLTETGLSYYLQLVYEHEHEEYVITNRPFGQCQELTRKALQQRLKYLPGDGTLYEEVVRNRKLLQMNIRQLREYWTKRRSHEDMRRPDPEKISFAALRDYHEF